MFQNDKELGKLEMVCNIITYELDESAEWRIRNDGLPRPNCLGVNYDKLVKWSGFSEKIIEEMHEFIRDFYYDGISGSIEYLGKNKWYEEDKLLDYMRCISDMQRFIKVCGISSNLCENASFIGIEEDKVNIRKIALEAYSRFLVDRIQNMFDRGWIVEEMQVLLHNKKFNENVFKRMKDRVKN